VGYSGSCCVFAEISLRVEVILILVTLPFRAGTASGYCGHPESLSEPQSTLNYEKS